MNTLAAIHPSGTQFLEGSVLDAHWGTAEPSAAAGKGKPKKTCKGCGKTKKPTIYDTCSTTHGCPKKKK